MTTRWFFSHAQQGVATGISTGPAVRSSVTFVREVDGRAVEETAPGPALQLVGPRDVVGIDRQLIFREEPPPGATDVSENFMPSVDFAHADLPWLLSTETVVPIPGAPAQPQPWLVLIVLSTEEASPPRPADPMPLLTAPVGALPPLSERWAWAHVEARLRDDVNTAATAAAEAAEGVRRRSGAVVARLLCPRRLLPDSDWIAAVVPVPGAGGWGAGPTVELPVHHWWTFHTGKPGDFESLATQLQPRDAVDLGLGSRRIDGAHPWPPAPGEAPAPPGDPVIIGMDGALKPTGGPPDTEVWSDSTRQDAFRRRMTEQLNAPVAQRETVAAEPDRDTLAVGPPLYGSHHSGRQTVSATGTGWQDTLNLEVRRRVAAALGARYVQLEQEFLMARAWEQVGQIREANRRLATAELAALAAGSAQAKNIVPQPPDMLVTTFAPIVDRVQVPEGFRTNPSLAGGNRAHTTLASVLGDAKVPDGMVSTAFSRVARHGGAVSRRMARASAAAEQTSWLASALPTTAAARPGFAADDTTLSERLFATIAPLPLQWRRATTEIGGAELSRRSLDDDARPLRPIMAHPHFDVPIAQEILSKWPEWALPGITGLPEDSVVVMETNPGFVAALLVGLNHEFNRELLWREFPTDQRGTPFARFWPTAGNDVDEIARWPMDSTLGSQISGGEEGSIALVIRGALLRRFPGLPLLVVPGDGGKLPEAFTGTPATQVPLDESTTLYLFSGISEERALAEDSFFVLREPTTGTRFGFDLPDPTPAGPMTSWAELEWDMIPVEPGRFVTVGTPPREQPPAGGGLAVWGNGSADMARIAFQQPFQLAIHASAWLPHD